MGKYDDWIHIINLQDAIHELDLIDGFDGFNINAKSLAAIKYYNNSRYSNQTIEIAYRDHV